MRSVLLTVLVLLAACAGDGVAPDRSGQFAEIQSTIFNPSCLGAGCHNAQFRAGNLDLTAAASYDQLVGQTPDNPVARAGGLLRVEPFSTENSFLVVKLCCPGPGEGSRMPRDAAPLSAAQMQLIEDWILAGAPPDGPTPTPLPAE